ncbi:MAG: 4-hydroxy-tetrahydrodipicolinate reductase [Clostridiales bacterium]
MKPFNYGIIGDSGKMGLEITNLFNEAGHKKVFSVDAVSEKEEARPDLLIDFSTPDVLDRTLALGIEFSSPVILGTTGYSSYHFELIRKASAVIPIVQSYNYSIGIQMLLKCTELLKENLSDWDIEITETHHRFKKDKPSGTAIMIKEAIGKDVPISSLRLGNVAGDHTVFFGGLGEVLSIKHSATSRRTFADGVLKSAEFLLGKAPGLYSFKDVLFKK